MVINKVLKTIALYQEAAEKRNATRVLGLTSSSWCYILSTENSVGHIAGIE